MGMNIFGVPPIPVRGLPLTKNPSQYNKKGAKKMATQKKKQAGQSGADGNQELRTKIVQVAYSPSEFDSLMDQYIKSPNSSLASLVRDKSLSRAVQVKDRDELIANRAKELRHLSKLGSNINQIAHRSNSSDVLSKIIQEFSLELEAIRNLKEQMFNKELRA